MLPLSKQNAYRERFKKLRPGWRTSGEEFEGLTRKHIGPGARVLDLGCGRGGVMELFWREAQLVVGLDPDHASLVEHRTRTPDPSGFQNPKGLASYPLVCGLGEALPFSAGAFDLVIAMWVLEHLPRPEAVLAEVRRVLRPGGRFIFLTPNALHPLVRANRLGAALPALQRRLIPRLYARAEADTFRVRYRANTPARLRTLAAAHGFRVASLRAIPDPTYLAFNDLMFRMSVLFERRLPEGWGVHVVGEWERLQTGQVFKTRPVY